MVHDLQTKLGHAELAHREASEAAKAAHEAQQIRLNEALTAERAARSAAEAALHEAAAAREWAERKHAPAQRQARPPAATPVKRPRKAAYAAEEHEPEPVKWWLKTASRR